MSPRIGRPKSQTPKNKQLGVRFDDETLKKLDKLVEYYNETRVEVIRRRGGKSCVKSIKTNLLGENYGRNNFYQGGFST